MAATDYDMIDPRFRDCVIGHATLEKLWTGCRWAEGPAYFAAHRSLVWSDIPNDRMLRFDECDGRVSVFRHPAGYSNGNTVDTLGRLVSCEHGGRRISRTGHDGRIETIASHHQGRRLNSPNDLVVKSDASIWFTDPPYGILSDYEGHKAQSEIGANRVYRVDPDGGEPVIVTEEMDKPNGIAFSPDESKLFIGDTGASHTPNGPRHIKVFDVSADGRLGKGRVFAESTAGFFDGFRFDADGRLWTSAGDGVHCYASDGALIGKVWVPETVANVEFGGPKRNRLYICATSSLYSVMLAVNGV